MDNSTAEWTYAADCRLGHRSLRLSDLLPSGQAPDEAEVTFIVDRWTRTLTKTDPVCDFSSAGPLQTTKASSVYDLGGPQNCSMALKGSH